MDDLLDLNWSSSAPSNVKQPVPKPQKPRDAFSDLLNSPSKPVDTTKLSLVEQQRLQQNSNTSPWLTPIQSSPINSNPISLSSRNGSPKLPTIADTMQSSNTTSSFEDLLNPFGTNIKKPTTPDRNTPLHQLRAQTNSTPVSDSQWDLDLLDSTLNNTTNNNSNTTSHVLDPFDMDSLIQESRTASVSPRIYEAEEDDNPLGILAHPAPKAPSSPSPPPQEESIVTHQDISSEQDTAHGNIMLDDDQLDTMIAQLIDMGFSLQESKFSIEATGGTDLQAAVDLLVQNSETVQRHEPETRRISQQQRTEISQNERARNALFSTDETSQRRKDSTPEPRQRGIPQEKQQQQQSTEAEAPFQTDKIVTQAQELGGFLFKNATSFLKTGREKVTKAVGDWQEQQRTQRLSQLQEEQAGGGGPVRPKWMTTDDHVEVSSTTVEKFADDEDSDNEQQDMESERRKIQEMRRLQELKQREQAALAHKQRQQQSLRKETLIKEEEVYVSPSRRRGTPTSSGRSTPRSNASSSVQKQRSITPQPQATRSVSPKENKRTRPVVNASSDIMAKVNHTRNIGNEKFKLGQFGDAEEAYTRAIEALPSGHDHHVLLCNNRAMARLKTGDYKRCVEDCDAALALAKQSGDDSITSEGIVIRWRDQIIKALYRKAEAFENIEKYKDALSTYDELIKLEGTSSAKINQGMSRCRQALNPIKPSSVKKVPASSSSPNKQQDFMSMFDPSSTATKSTASTVIVSAEELSKSKAVTAMRAKAAEQEAEDAEKLEKVDDVNARLTAWKTGKEQNLRALLATLDTLLWPGAQWKGAQMSELINPKKCKITYMKAIGKLPSDVTVEQRMLASGIFSSLNEAWDSFKTQNQM
ncbi:hypothetical protein INT48_003611 [Thamnidium elegans]|uniref:UBA domain-containing protein n=1 Tax=Thamnidium elegans TaxID=101142 RepID=A0A8H7W0W0_9FUNG|nr:hypothetical protein INT48_003611 [Thamnidium elegans]